MEKELAVPTAGQADPEKDLLNLGNILAVSYTHLFGDISLTLILPEQAPYLLESSVPLRQAQGKARTYTAQLLSLIHI